MKRPIKFLASFFLSILWLYLPCKANSQAFEQGEELTYALYYNSAVTGNVTAGEMFSRVNTNPQTINGRQLMHIVLEGETKGAFRWFFNAKDRYETYVDPTNYLPYYFKQRVKEGSFIVNKDVVFNQANGLIKSVNNQNQDVRHYNTEHNVQDLLSSFYYIRNWNFDKLRLNQVFEINLFMDDSVYQIQFEFKGYANVNTKIGKIACLIFAPHVITGSVFADETPMMIYVSNDRNHVPVFAESELSIGRARIELIKHSGLRYALNYSD
jgi:hypothetical protein